MCVSSAGCAIGLRERARLTDCYGSLAALTRKLLWSKLRRRVSFGGWLLWVQVRREHEEVRKRRLDEFMAGFNSISLKLKEMYQMITMGGDAELELVDSLDPFSEVKGRGRGGGELGWLLAHRAGAGSGLE